MNRGRRVFLTRPARRPGAEEKFFCPGTRFAVIPLIIEVIQERFVWPILYNKLSFSHVNRLLFGIQDDSGDRRVKEV